MVSTGRRTLGLSCPRISHSSIALALQVDGRKYPCSEDGIQIVVIDGNRGHVVSHGSFRNAILQGIPWQLFNYVAAIPDK